LIINTFKLSLYLGASFEITSLKRFHLPSVPKFIGHCYQGIAAKPLSSGLSTSQDTKEFFH